MFFSPMPGCRKDRHSLHGKTVKAKKRECVKAKRKVKAKDSNEYRTMIKNKALCP